MTRSLYNSCLFLLLLCSTAAADDGAVEQIDIENIPGVSVFTALGISVAAGIVVITLSLLVKLIWSWWLENIYLKLTCRHLADISGDWFAEYELDDGWNCRDETIIKQHGYKLEGESRFTLTKGQETEIKVFKIFGVLRNDLFSGYYYNKNRRQKGSGSFTYKITGEGELEGKGVFYEVRTDELSEVEYTLKPNKG